MRGSDEGSVRKRPRVALTVLVMAMLALATPSLADAATVTVSTTGNDTTCARDGAPCLTVARGVAVAIAGDTVQVGPGTFPITGSISVSKSLRLLGAQANVDARTRTITGAGETLLTGGANVFNLTVAASNVTVNGFAFQGNARAVSSPTAGVAGLQIVNNIVANSTGYLMANPLGTGGAQNTIAQNQFDGNRIDIYVDVSGAGRGNLTVRDNVFRNATTGSTFGSHPGGTNLTYTRNQIVNSSGPTISGFTGIDVTDNTITGPGAIGFRFIGRQNEEIRVLRNTISGMTDAGISLTGEGGAPQNRNVKIRQNTILDTRGSGGDNQGLGIRIAANGADGRVQIVHNRLVGNARAGLRNQDTDAEIEASPNWWGCNTGPGFTGCDDVTSPDGGSNPDFQPWLTLSLTARPPDPAAGATSSLLARLSNLSSGGTALSGARRSQAPANVFFDTATATFGSDPAGSFNPAGPVPLSPDTLEAESTFTAAARPSELRTTVDNQTVRIINANPPQSDVVPDIVPTDPTLRPGQIAALGVLIVNRGNRVARRLRACLRVSRKLNLTGERCREFARLRPGQSIIYRVRVRALLSACRGGLMHRLRLQVAGQPVRVDAAAGRLLAGLCRRLACPAVAAGRTAGAHASGAAYRPRRVHARSAC